MNVIKRIVFCLLVIAPFFLTAQNTLTVKVKKVASSDGYIAVGVFTSSAGFLKEGKAFAGTFEVAKEGITVVEIPNLPNGIYAVSIFHDSNGNKKLDTNFLGIPKESCAFSNAKMKMFGPPSFKDCAFEMNADFEIEIGF